MSLEKVKRGDIVIEVRQREVEVIAAGPVWITVKGGRRYRRANGHGETDWRACSSRVRMNWTRKKAVYDELRTLGVGIPTGLPFEKAEAILEAVRPILGSSQGET